MIYIYWLGFAVGLLGLLTWIWLFFFHGEYWRFREKTIAEDIDSSEFILPQISVLIPARNEEEVLPETLPSLFEQNYPGKLEIFLVNDNSTDDTRRVATQIAQTHHAGDNFHLIENKPTPAGWSGKVWALHRGFKRVKQAQPGLVLLTDADIQHSPDSIRQLVSHLILNDLDLVSFMAKLQVETFWEKLLIPSFVYYFSMVFPFKWVNEPKKSTAAAAGGCVLLKKSMLKNAGGFASISDAIIDDCALAKLIKSEGGSIWLGLSNLVTSIRSYGGLRGVWNMVSRSAFSQLNHSFLLLLGTVLGLVIIFFPPPALLITGVLGVTSPTITSGTLSSWGYMGIALISWITMSATFRPIIDIYGLPRYYTLLAPLSGGLYAMMTIDSAYKWLRGDGGSWKGRTYG